MRKHVSFILSLILIVSMLAGCSSDKTDEMSKNVKVNETISPTSKWIDSTIDGAIDENTVTNEKDDFYTAVNKDWILSQTLTKDKTSISLGTTNDEVLMQRKLDIVKGDSNSEDGENPAEIPNSQLKHDEDLLVDFGAFASNWEDRNQKGVEPIRPYVEAITSISSIQEMTDYILNQNSMNFSFLLPFNITVGTTYQDHSTNVVKVDMTNSFILDSAQSYNDITDTGKFRMQASDASVEYLLTKLGYKSTEIKKIIKDCYRYETRLANIQIQSGASSTDIGGYLDETNNSFALSEIKDLQGDFPLTEVMSTYGYDCSNSFSVAFPKYITGVGKIYNDKYLSEIKAYYLVHTLNDCMPLLDRDTFDYLQTLVGEMEESESKEKGDVPDTMGNAEDQGTEEEKETKLLFENYIQPYLSEPLDQVYIARYCTASQKAQLKSMIEEIVNEYREMLKGEDWLSEQAREMAIEKLDNLTIRVVYPDTFTDYSSLDLSKCDTLVDAVATINAFKMGQKVDKINTQAVKEDWDLTELPTTIANATYMPLDNSINILAGIIADESLFNVDFDYEENLAKIGMIIGHEITHGFDTTGYQFDKDGYYKSWWTDADLQTFQIRATKLANFYSGIVPYPGASGYDGDSVKGEAIADMGGVKCMLCIAENKPDFDYDKFFRSYAMLWRSKNTYSVESSLAGDVHPLNYLRTNVVLQQFDKFNETYHITEGDGMYLAPDKRVTVW